MNNKELNQLKMELVRVQAQLDTLRSSRFMQDGINEKIMMLEKKEQELIEKIDSFDQDKYHQIRH